MSAWLHVVGIGEDGLDGLTPAARASLDSAELLIGGHRHLAMLPESDQRERMTWPSPFGDLIERICAHRDRRVCVLATGDPSHFGVGVTLARHIPANEMQVFPSPSAFALACARMGWNRSDVETLTLHGRPLTMLNAYVQPGAKLLVLSQDAHTPNAVADALRAAGFGESELSVLEHMGGPRERVRSTTPNTFDLNDCADFNTLAIHCVAGPNAHRLPRLPGLPDDAFEHDGQLTKRSVRAATLAALAPLPGEMLWDIGAGCGSVAVEWMRTHPRNRAAAIERRADRISMCAANAQALGVPGLQIERGDANSLIDTLATPDAVFIGGGISSEGLFERCWAALPASGRLVANVVTMEGEHTLYRLHQAHGGTLSRIAVSHAVTLGAFHGFRPAMPVTQALLGEATMSATLYGLGIGPGDPELITLKALNILQRVPVLAYPAPDKGDSLARAIVASHLPGNQTEIIIRMPMVLERFPAQAVYDQAALDLGAHLDAGRDVAVLCEGDPFFYGSFMYLFARMNDRHRVEVIPGVSSLTACAAALDAPLAARNDVLTVVPATLDEQHLKQRLEDCDAAAIIKVGRHVAKVHKVLEELGLTAVSRYVEHATMTSESVRPLADVDASSAPYFSMVLVHRRGLAWQ